MSRSNSQQTIYSLNVGQADAKLIVSPDGTTTLIDADESQVTDELDRIFEEELSIQGDEAKTIDHFVVTHIHQDHILGLFDLKESGYNIKSASQPNLARFEVGEKKGLVDPDLFQDYIEALSEHDISPDGIDNLSSGDTLESVSGEVLSPPSQSGTVSFESPKTGEERSLKPEQANENGLVIKVGSDEDTSTLIMGDMQDSSAHHGEDWLVRQHIDGQLDLGAETLHIGHHGSDNATNDGYGTTEKGSFIDAVNPDEAIISSELKSEYSHPRDDVLDRLEEQDIDVHWTGVHGTIKQAGDEEEQIERSTEIDATTPADILALKHYAKANDVDTKKLAALEEGSISADDLPRDTPELAFKSKYLETADKAAQTVRRYPSDAKRLTLNRFPKAMSTEYVSVDDHAADRPASEADTQAQSSMAQRRSQHLNAATDACMADIRQQREQARQRLVDESPQASFESQNRRSETTDQSTTRSRRTQKSDQSEQSDQRQRR